MIWDIIPHRNGYEIYQLYVAGKEDAQGMIALKHIRDQLFTHVDIVEEALLNVGRNGRYSGVGAHLIDKQNMYIDSYGAIERINKYFKEGLS